MKEYLRIDILLYICNNNYTCNSSVGIDWEGFIILPEGETLSRKLTDVEKTLITLYRTEVNIIHFTELENIIIRRTVKKNFNFRMMKTQNKHIKSLFNFVAHHGSQCKGFIHITLLHTSQLYN